MRLWTVLSFALAGFIGGSSADAAISPHQAATRIKAAARASSVVTDKSEPYRSTLGGVVKGTKYVRTFKLDNRHTVFDPTGGPASINSSGARVQVGGVATGKINLRTEQVTFKSYDRRGIGSGPVIRPLVSGSGPMIHPLKPGQ